MSEYARALVWFRRDLRDFDHAALYHALKQARQVACAFVFDREILDALADPADRRVEFIHTSLASSFNTAPRATRSCGWPSSLRSTPCSSTKTTAPRPGGDAAVEAALCARGIAVHHTPRTR
jgi:hypothetical protein